jgi:cysteine synthase
MPVFVFRGGEGSTPDQGIGAGIIPELLDIPMLDCVMTVPSDEALDEAFWLASPQVLHLLLLFR